MTEITTETKPCKRGHVSERYSNGNCKQCLLDREAEKRSDPEWAIAKAKRETERYWQDREKKLAYDREYRIRLKAEISERRKELYQQKPHHYTERNARRRARQKLATPKWAELAEIRRFYKDAKELTKTSGIQMSVDHIVPLISDRVCGLHCPANLRIISNVENSIKGHRWWPDMFEREDDSNS